MSTHLKLIVVILEVLWIRVTWEISAQCPDGFTLNPGDSYCYKLVSEAMAWTDARMYCHAFGADLAKIDDSNTQDFINGLVSGAEYWIGANDVMAEGDFRWNDYSAVTFEEFGGSQPNGGTDQNCVVHTGTVHGKTWHDRVCSDPYPFICQRIPGPSANERQWSAIDSVGLSHRQILRQCSTRSLLECANFCQLDPSCDLFAFNKTNTNSQEANCFATMFLTAANSSDSWTGYLTYQRQFSL